jgi:four helix bundle protein
MPIRSFKDIVAWQKAQDLTIEIYREFSNCRDYSFKDQIQRAAISIMNNIAEGYAKQSNKSFRNYLLIAKGSTAELESMLLVAPSLGLITEERQLTLLEKANEISRLIVGFVRKIPS